NTLVIGPDGEPLNFVPRRASEDDGRLERRVVRSSQLTVATWNGVEYVGDVSKVKYIAFISNSRLRLHRIAQLKPVIPQNVVELDLGFIHIEKMERRSLDR